MYFFFLLDTLSLPFFVFEEPAYIVGIQGCS